MADEPTNAGLRARKKAATRRALLDEAERCVREGGLGSLRVRSLADRVGVSEASFYNYFGSRDALLGEWAHETLSRALEASPDLGESSPRRSGGSLRGRLRAPLRTFAASVVAERALMRELWRRAPLLPDRAAPGARGAAADPFVRAVAAAQQSGELRADVSAGELADALRSAAGTAVVRELSDEGAASDGLAPALLRAVDLILDGARKRNERVRPERRAPGGPAGGGGAFVSRA